MVSNETLVSYFQYIVPCRCTTVVDGVVDFGTKYLIRRMLFRLSGNRICENWSENYIAIFEKSSEGTTGHSCVQFAKTLFRLSLNKKTLSLLFVPVEIIWNSRKKR